MSDYDKYINTPEFYRFVRENFDERLNLANLVSKSDIAQFIKMTNFN